jgi:lysophospholipase L1-like esterase
MTRALLKNLLALLLGLMLALVLLEGLIRIFEPIEFRVRGNKFQLSINRKYIVKDLGIPKFDKVIYYNTNWLGFRGKNPPKDFADYLTIIAVGGSTTLCRYNSEGKTWVDLLGQKLDKSFPKFWINNAGFDGQSTIGHLILMDDIIAPLKPKVVLFLVGANDQFLEEQKVHDQHFLRKSKSSLSYFIENMLNKSDIYYYISNYLRYAKARKFGMLHYPVDMTKIENKYLTTKQIEEFKEGHRTQKLISYKERLINLVEICNKNGIEPVFITQPYLLGKGIDEDSGVNLATAAVRAYNGEVAWGIVELYNDVLRQTAKDHHILLIDLAKELPKRSKYYYDFYHYTNEGSALTAEIIYRHLYPFLKNRYAPMMKSKQSQPPAGPGALLPGPPPLLPPELGGPGFPTGSG